MKAKQPKIKLPPKGAKNRVPKKEWVQAKVKALSAPKHEDGYSSPELTAAYVEEFCRLNHLRHPVPQA